MVGSVSTVGGKSLTVKKPAIGVLQSIARATTVAACLALAGLVAGCAIGPGGGNRENLRDQVASLHAPAGSASVNCRDVEVFSFASESDSLMVGCFDLDPSRDSDALDSVIGEVAQATGTTFQSDWSCEMIAADVAYCMATMQGGDDDHPDLKAFVSYPAESLSDEFPSEWPDGADVGFALASGQ